jgi:preprotein translocase subunit SecE
MAKEQDGLTGQVVEAKEKSVSTTKPEKQEEKQHSLIGGAGQFLKEVAIEHRKITWPERKQVVRETWSVLVLVAAITLVVLGIDWVLGNVIFGPIEHWARLHGAGLGRG